MSSLKFFGTRPTGLEWLVVAFAWAGCAIATAQHDNPVYVDDSPRAWELFRRARDQSRDNAGEAVRLNRELLDDYAMKLLPVTEASADHFVSVRRRVLAELRGSDRLLERFRSAETAAAKRMLTDLDLERLAETRPVTGPGLEALLRLAQASLESAHFHAAIDRLRQAAEHPDLDAGKAAHCWYMIGVAASYLGDDARLDEADAALRALGTEGRALLEQLDRLRGAGVPVLLDGTSTLDLARSAEIERLVAQPIWAKDLEDMPLSRRVADPVGAEPANRRHVAQLRRSGALLTAAPTVASSRVFLNEGRTVHALDRFTGRPVWPSFVERLSPSSVEKGSRQIADLNVVAIEGNTLVTITGHAYADAARSDRTVVCLDADTGRFRWGRRIDRLTSLDELDGLFPHGAPVIGDGLVYVLARKVSRQLLTSCYLIAMDLADGRLRWYRHVASSGGIRSRYARPFSTPLYHDGDLAVATAIGAVARIDGTTGEVLWLRRYNPPLSPYLADRNPWEMSGPVVTPRGVVAIRPDHREIIMLDWATGGDITGVGAGARDAWNSPRYLLNDGNVIYGVGGDIRAFHADAIDRPIWTFPDAEARESELRNIEHAEIRGRVQVTGGGLIVPTLGGLLLLDADTGAAIHRVDIESVGNPLTADAQLIVAGSDALEAYMPLDRAQQMLRQQIALSPADPDPALALMRLGVRVRDLDLSLEAAELAIRAINIAGRVEEPDASRQELFDVLLELDRADVAETLEEGEALHAMIGLVAQEPTQRVEHLLAYGAWLSSHALGAAVEAYQTILSTPSLAGAPRQADGLVLPASTWAARRIAALIERHGRAAYRPQADFAAQRLAQLRHPPDPAALLALAREFPFADSSLSAARLAAAEWASAGEARRAASALAEAYRAAPTEPRGAALLGLLAGRAAESGWPGFGRDVLDYAVATWGDIALDTGSGPRSAEAWLAELDPRGRLPRVGENRGAAERLEGLVVPAYPGSSAAAPPDRALLHDQGGIELRSAALDELWSAQLDPGAGGPWLLRHDRDALVLWTDGPGDEPAAVRLDPADGARLWISPAIPELRADAGRDGRPDVGRRGEQYDPNEVMPLLGGEALVLVARSGRVAAVSAEDGRSLLWQRIADAPLDRVHVAVRHETVLVLAGAKRPPGRAEAVPRIAVLDPATGRTLRTIEPMGGRPVRWVTIGPLGGLVYGNDAGIESVDPVSGRPWWGALATGAAGSERAWRSGGHVIVESPAARGDEGANPLRSYRVVDGTSTGAFDVPQRGEWDRLDLRELVLDRGRIFARYGQRIVRFSSEGKVLGADVVSDLRDYQALLPTGDRLLAVSRFKTETVAVEGRDRPVQQYTYRIYSLSENCRLMGDGVELPPMNEPIARATVIDDWLMVSSASGTLAVPMPVERP